MIYEFQVIMTRALQGSKSGNKTYNPFWFLKALARTSEKGRYSLFSKYTTKLFNYIIINIFYIFGYIISYMHGFVK